MELVNSLREKNITYIGTVKSNSRSIPSDARSTEGRQRKDTKIYKEEQHGTFLVSFWDKGAKPVLLLDSFHPIGILTVYRSHTWTEYKSNLHSGIQSYQIRCGYRRQTSQRSNLQKEVQAMAICHIFEHGWRFDKQCQYHLQLASSEWVTKTRTTLRIFEGPWVSANPRSYTKTIAELESNTCIDSKCNQVARVRFTRTRSCSSGEDTEKGKVCVLWQA